MFSSLELFRETYWGSTDGRQTKIKDLEDTHLANIIYHCKRDPQTYGIRIMSLLEEEARSRNLSQAFLNRAPIPWKDADGKWKRFNEMTKQYEVIGR